MKKTWITWVFVGINMALFASIAAGGTSLIHPSIGWGALSMQQLNDGEYWRLITHLFVHCNATHLLTNICGLILVGRLLEPVMGSIRFALCFILSGVFASFVSLWWDQGIPIYYVGSSGAIFGMVGVLVALLSSNVFAKKPPRQQFIGIAVYLGYNLFLAPSSYAAHIGGFLVGIVLGYVHCLSYQYKRLYFSYHALILIVVPMLVSDLLKGYSKTDEGCFQRIYGEYCILEDEVFGLERELLEGIESNNWEPIDRKMTENYREMGLKLDSIEKLDVDPIKAEIKDHLVAMGRLRARRHAIISKRLQQGSLCDREEAELCRIHMKLRNLMQKEF